MENEKRERGRSRAQVKTGWKAELISWIQVIISAAVIAFVLTTFIIANSEVPTGSMENTIMAGSRVIGSRLHYKWPFLYLAGNVPAAMSLWRAKRQRPVPAAVQKQESVPAPFIM